VVAFSEQGQNRIKNISYWGCIVSRHCEGNDSRERIRCTCQAKV